MDKQFRKTFALATLGCKVNQYESQVIREQFQNHNFNLVDFSQKADLYIINTCTVTGKSDQESHRLIRNAHKKNNQAKIIVAGCYVQNPLQKISKIKGVSLVVNNQDKDKIFDKYQGLCLKEKKYFSLPLDSAYEPLHIKDFFQRSRAFVKIQDGCNNFCSYCIIPYIRGRSRSRSFKDIQKEIDLLTTKGFKEIVLVGINLGQYGQDLSSKHSLPQIIEELSKNTNLSRLRLSSINVSDIGEELIDLIVKNSKICKHLHIPLQSGSDFILKQMNRKYNSNDYRKLVTYLRERISEISIATDILVGFPGEENFHFEETYTLAKELSFNKIHVFKYSPRPCTKAYLFPDKVSDKIKKQRSNILRELSSQNRSSFMESYKSKEVEVLIEEYKPSLNLYLGYSSNYIRVGVRSLVNIVGKIVKANIKEIRKDYMIGEKI